MQPIISKKSSEINQSNSQPLLSKKSSEINQPKSFNYILTKLNELTISFRNKDENYNTQYSTKDEEDLNIESNTKGLVISKNSMKKILKISGLSLGDLNNYLLYTVTETVINEKIEQITTFNIEYKLLVMIIKNFFIGIGGEKTFALGKDSMEKIFKMLQYDTNQRMEYLLIYEISEHEVEFNKGIREALECHKLIEEEDEPLDSNIDWNISPGVNNGKMKKLFFFDLENIISEIDKEKEKRSKQFEDKIEAPQSNIETPNAEDDNVINEIIVEQTNPQINPKKPVKAKKEKPSKPPIHFEEIIEEKNEDKQNISTILSNNSKKIEEIDKLLEKKNRSCLLEKLKGIDKEKEIHIIEDDSIIIPFSISNPSITNACNVYVSGSCKELGCWNTSKATLLVKNNFMNNYYTKNKEIKRDSFPFEYKFFLLDKYSEISWIGEPFKNFKVSQKMIPIIDSRRFDTLQLFQLNIRYFNDVDEMNCWDIRKAPQIDIIISSQNDILFFQEVTTNQWKELDIHLSVIYENVGCYRSSDFNDEAIPIYYHKKKYKLIKSGQFWLSSTPSVRGSKSFGNYFPRVCTWVQLSLTSNNKSFLLFNTQLDHLNLQGNLSLTKVLLETMKKIINEAESIDFVILGGCYYCDEDDPLIKLIIANGFSKVKFNKCTFHGFTGTGYKTYDYIFFKNIENKKGIKLKKCNVYDSESIINKAKNIYISDHYPVSAEFEI